MAEHVCPAWVGYMNLAEKYEFQNPEKINIRNSLSFFFNRKY